MTKILDYLENLGLSDFEARLYVHLIETGPKSAQDLARLLKINRSTVYGYINELMDKGLIIKSVNGSRTFFSVEEIDRNLENLLKEKIELTKKIETNFPTILKDITAKVPQNLNSEEFEVKYYKGELGVRKIYEDALKTKELRSYVNPSIVTTFLPENTPMFETMLNSNSDIKMYEIFDGSDESNRHVNKFIGSLKNSSNYIYKFLPKNITLSASDTLIYDGKVCIINAGEQTSGIVLKNTDYYKNAKELFDFMWQILPEVKK